MNQEKEFGLLISVILPGVLVLIGLSAHSSVLADWIGSSDAASPTVGGFLFLTVASVFVGMTVSTIRWAILDSFHYLTGLRQPTWNFANLASRESGFNTLVDAHYRYYQLYGNSIFSTIFLLLSRWTTVGFSTLEAILGVFLCVLFFAGSRDSLSKYYSRVNALLSSGL